ncbi:MAG: hypothetical protein HUU28_09310 [Planctomycetaceae bacterium]|nr:hypothetical protein [Planctomycetaceae bacterium]
MQIDKELLFEDLGYEPHPGQLAVHNSSARFRVVACGVRWGKTTAAAMEAVVAALEPREKSIGWIVAPTYDLADRVFREIEVIVLERLRHRLVMKKDADRRLQLRNLAGGVSEIRAKSADNPVSLLGEGLDFVVVDEAARLKPAIWQNHISQRLIDKRGWALLISTPKGKGYFFDLYRRGQRTARDPEYESWNMPTWTNPLLDRTLIEAERAKLPQRVFEQEYGAQFCEGAGAVFRNVRERATGTWKEPARGEVYFGGLDLAKVEDFTVLTIINAAREVVFVDRFHRLDWGLQIARIRAALQRYNGARATCDVTGVGDPVYEQLRRDGCSVVPYPFTAKSKSALIENLSLMLEQRTLVLPRPEICPELIDELESFEYSVTESGNVRTGAPSGGHDDCVVSLALAAWQVRKVGGGFRAFRAGPRW